METGDDNERAETRAGRAADVGETEARAGLEADGPEAESAYGAGEEGAGPELQMPLPIVIGRILIVSGMSFAAALAIFFLVGGVWQIAAGATGITLLFLLAMFALERAAER